MGISTTASGNGRSTNDLPKTALLRAKHILKKESKLLYQFTFFQGGIINLCGRTGRKTGLNRLDLVLPPAFPGGNGGGGPVALFLRVRDKLQATGGRMEHG